MKRATPLLSPSDAQDIADKVVDMADRVRIAHAITPGAAAVSGFSLDGVEYVLTVKCKPAGDGK